MDFDQLWQEYKELVLVIATAVATLVATLLGQKILPGLWKAIVKLWEKMEASLGKHLSAGRFERRYLEWLCEEQLFLKVRGIRTRSPVSVKLEEVYVSLTLNRPSRREANGQTGVKVVLMEELPEGRRLEQDPRLEIRAEESERLSIGQVLQSCPERLVILGGPGTGKTTLLSYLVLKFARGQAQETLELDEERLPVLIPLRELPRTGLSLTAENLPALCVAPEIAKECPADFFKKHLQDGNCIVLLDGMDEVTSEKERRRVAEQIEDFVTTYRDNRFVVTSRPAGYSGVALAGFTQLDICDFSDEDVEAFARYWCLAVELAVRRVESEISEAVARRKAEREAGELVTAIRASDRVRHLTVNPLLLTIVAMVHRYRATLPNRRVELYDECTEVLLGYWDQAKGIAGQLDWKRKRRILEPLAHWMHQEGLREAGRAQVEQVIAQALPTVGEKETGAAEFLKNVRERSGLLMERGLGIYGFSHLTFQEYLTASYLIDRREKGREELLKHLHDSWWLEVTLLYAGMQDATPLIEAILAQRDDIFENNLFLAARCLVDVVNIDPYLQEQVLARLLEEFRASEFQGLRERATGALIELGDSPSAPRVVEGLVGLLGDADENVRGRATSALGRLGQAEPGVVEGLVGLLGDEEANVRWSATSALGRLGQAEPGVVEGLVGLLGDADENVRGRAAYALGEVGQAEPGVVEGLVGLLGDADENVRGRAAYALGRLGQAEPGVVEGLVGLLGDEEANVRWSAAYALGEVGKAEPGVVEGLVGLLGDADENVRGRAASALGEVGQAEPGVVEGLVGLLGDENEDVRGRAAYALGRLGQAGPGVVEVLVGLMGAADENVRWNAAYALGRLGQAEPGVVEVLVGLLGDADGNVRGRAASALGEVGQAEPGVVEVLVGLMGDADENVRGRAASALGRLGQAEPGVVEVLVGLLGDADGNVRGRAAYALGQLGQAEPGVVEILLQRLGDKDIDPIHAFRVLRAKREVVSSLITAICSPDRAVSSGAALALDIDSRVILGEEKDPAISSRRVSSLKQLLNSEAEVDYSIFFAPLGKHRKVKDVSWGLLRHYSEETGERIYRGSGEARR